VKKFIKELAVGVVILFVVSLLLNHIRKPDLDSDALPAIDVKLIDGSVFHGEKGKAVIIHFWGSWCPICKLEAPNIQSVSENYNVLTIAVNSGSDREIKAYMKKHDLSFKVLNDREGEWAKMFKVEVFPTTFIYDGEGKLRFTEVGYTTTAGLTARMMLLTGE